MRAENANLASYPFDRSRISRKGEYTSNRTVVINARDESGLASRLTLINSTKREIYSFYVNTNLLRNSASALKNKNVSET